MDFWMAPGGIAMPFSGGSRRELLRQSLLGALGAGVTWSLRPGSGQSREEKNGGNLHVAPFFLDVTPPIGHPCCGGWIKPVEVVDDPLEARGIVILGAGKPIVLCAVDWTGVLNGTHVAWRTAMAEAAGTTPDRVALHCVHQHNAPFACLDAESIIALEIGRGRNKLSHILNPDWFKNCADRSREAIARAIAKAQPVSRIGWGEAKVDRVASNRRVSRDKSGKVLAMRGSACRDSKLRDLPEGLIDPFARTIAFFNGEKKIASCHFYAVHPMSFYADGRVTGDFAGLARKALQAREPDCAHIYFTGCAGDIAAGKYNDGSKASRIELTQRLFEGIVASEKRLETTGTNGLSWRTVEVVPKARPQPGISHMASQIANSADQAINPNRIALELAFHQRAQKQIPLVLGSLQVGPVRTMHLPAETFVEYQLNATKIARIHNKDAFVATAAYGDGGPWYIPTPAEFPNGGYEVSVAFGAPSLADSLSRGMESLLA